MRLRSGEGDGESTGHTSVADSLPPSATAPGARPRLAVGFRPAAPGWRRPCGFCCARVTCFSCWWESRW